MIDSHAHVAFDQLEEGQQQEEIIARANEAGVRWLEVGTDLAQSKKALALAKQYPENVIGTSAGVHPSDIAVMTEEAWQEIEALLDDPVVVAVGEVGLDYHHGDNVMEQAIALDRFLKMAVDKKKPVIFHLRDGAAGSAHDDLLTALAKREETRRPAGVIHTFSGNYKQAEAYIKLGMHISFSGVVTYKNATEIAEVAKSIPLTKILIETDAPFLTPEPHRGKQNEPANVALVAKKIAELRGDSLEEVIEATVQNTKTLFGV